MKLTFISDSLTASTNSILTFLLFFFSCTDNNNNLEFYEKVSGVKFPSHYSTIEYFDNGEFITASVFRIGKENISKFISENTFKKVNADFKPDFTGLNYLKKENLKFPSNETLYELSGRTASNTWYFLIDQETGTTWAEIQYPDFAGDKP